MNSVIVYSPLPSCASWVSVGKRAPCPVVCECVRSEKSCLVVTDAIQEDSEAALGHHPVWALVRLLTRASNSVALYPTITLWLTPRVSPTLYP